MDPLNTRTRMPERGLRLHHRRPLRPEARLSVVVGVGSKFFSNKNNPRGSLCSIEHDFLSVLRLWSCVRAAYAVTLYSAQRHAYPARYSPGGAHPGVPGSTSPIDRDMTRMQARQALTGGPRTFPPAARARGHAALAAIPTSHRLHWSTPSPLPGTAAHRATGSHLALVTPRVTETNRRVTNAHAETKPLRHSHLHRIVHLVAIIRSSHTPWTEPTLDSRRATLAWDPMGLLLPPYLYAKPRPVGPPYHLSDSLSDPVPPDQSGPLSARGAHGDHE